MIIDWDSFGLKMLGGACGCGNIERCSLFIFTYRNYLLIIYNIEMPNYFKSCTEAFLRLFYPATCEVCSISLSLEETSVCNECRTKLHAAELPLPDTYLAGRFEYLDHVWTVYEFRSPLREILHSIKYQHQDHLMKTFRNSAIRLAQAITGEFDYDAVLPIPISYAERIRRQFNQTELLSALVAPHIRPRIRTGMLTKRCFVPSQTTMRREERAINIFGAFKVPRSCRLTGQAFLIIDDVFTTGATANEAARVLKAAGARRIDLFALARASAGHPRGKGALQTAPEK